MQQADHTRSTPAIRAWETLRQNGVYLTLAALLISASLLSPAFLRPANLFNVVRQSAALGIVGLGQTLVVIGGGVDLSVAGVISLTSVLSAGLMNGQNARVLPVVLLCALLGTVVGLVNGLLVTRRGAQPFVITLGTMVVVQGSAMLYTGGAPKGTIPPLLRFLGNGAIASVPTAVLVLVLLAGASSFMLKRTLPGRQLLVSGANPAAARLAGVPVDRAILLSYVLSAWTAVLGGLVIAGYIGVGDNWVGRGYDLDSIAGVVVGGTALGGGRGGGGGTLAGIGIMAILYNLILLLNLPVEVQLLVKALVIIGSVASYTWRQSRS